MIVVSFDALCSDAAFFVATGRGATALRTAETATGAGSTTLSWFGGGCTDA